MAQKRVTIKDIAELSGVSFQAVSSVLHNTGNSRVSEEKAIRVRQIAKKLNYQPNRAACSLVNKLNYQIGICFPSYYFEDSYSEMLFYLQCFLQDRGFNSHIMFWDSLVTRGVNVKNIGNLGIDGLIHCGEIPELFACKLPCLVFGISDRLHSVVSDYEMSFDLIFEHLLSRGYRKIGYIGSLMDDPMRPALFRSRLDRNGLEYREEWMLNCMVSYEDGSRVFREFLEKGGALPEVFVTHNDVIAISAMREARNGGLNVPSDLGFVGYDDIRCSGYVYPALTTIQVGTRRIAEVLADKMMALVRNPETPVEKTVLTPQLIVRESCRK